MAIFSALNAGIISSTIAGVVGSVPVNTVLPAISGTAQQGQTLTSSTGTWTNSPTGYIYQWNRAGTPISGATAATYLLAAADVGSTITVSVTASNASGAGVAATSAATAIVTSLLTKDFLASDGATQQPFLSGGAIYEPSINQTWVTRQRTNGAGGRIAAVNAINHTSGAVASYDMFADLENQDGHGGAVLCRLPSGYWHAVGGVHGAPYFKYSVTANTDDPTVWNDAGNILGGAGIALTYPQPLYIDGSLYVFARNSLASTAPYGYIKASAISASGVPTFTNTHVSVLDMGANTRTYGRATVLPNGYEVLMACCYDDYNDRLGRQNVYVCVFNTRTGNVRNFQNTASQAAPATKTWLDANGGRLVDQIGAGTYGNIPDIFLDDSGNPFVFYTEGPTYAQPPCAVKCINWTGSAWSTPATIYNSAAQSSFNQVAAAATGSGKMRAYFQTDGSSAFPRGGDISYSDYVPGTGWGTPVLIKTATAYAFANTIAVKNAIPESRVAFGEFPHGLGSIEPTIYGGTIRRYLYGDSGPITQPYSEDADVTTYFSKFTSPPAVGTVLRRAVGDLVADLKAIGGGTVWPKIDFMYLLANQDEQAAYLNLKPNPAFNATKVGTLTFGATTGIATAGSGRLVSNFNPTTAAGAYALNNAHTGVFTLNNIDSTGTLVAEEATTTFIAGLTRQSTGFPRTKINVSAGTTGGSVVNRSDGLLIWYRSGSALQGHVVEGQTFGSGDTSASSQVPNSSLSLFGNQGAPVADGHQVAAWFAGGHLGAENYQVMGNAIRRYLLAVGAAPARTERQQLNQSNTFSSGFWAKGANLTLTTGRTDPFGGTTATRLQASATSPTTANTTISQASSVDPGVQDTGQSNFYNNSSGSVWVRSDTASQNIMVYDGSAYTAIAVTSTWKRVNWQTAQNYHTFLFASYDGSALRFTDIDIYGAQLDPGGTPGTYKALP